MCSHHFLHSLDISGVMISTKKAGLPLFLFEQLDRVVPHIAVEDRERCVPMLLLTAQIPMDLDTMVQLNDRPKDVSAHTGKGSCPL
ncbi:hypothetical protein CSHISOI_07239 [Colletotrichum shisoi]|uniref:Uncharacterized protein n=1 Tax=Colletotrichum shisoi TaxID=2078593 RepID=A0A5Q4BMR8_9PEZI|nr:hypothetical protein CSHISOI_07239 [Colletotrichum shisoi]